MSTENTSNVQVLNNCPRTQATDFWQIQPCPGSSCKCQRVFVSTDPRTKDYTTNTMKEFDRPPYQVTIDGFSYNDLYNNPRLGKPLVYDSYANIDIGDYTYYVDPTNQTPYLPEVYTIPSRIIPTAIQDPISRVRIEYVKIPTKCPVSPYQETQDTLNFREDIMSLRAIKQNRPLYSLAVGLRDSMNVVDYQA